MANEAAQSAVSEPIIWSVGVQGAPQTAQEFENLRQKIAQLPVANDNAAQSFQRLGVASGLTSDQMMRLRGAGVMAIRDIAYNVPQLQPFVGILTGITTAARGLTSVLGLSGGLAVGGLLLGISLLAKYFAESGEAAEKAAAKIKAAKVEVKDFDFYLSKIKKEQGDKARNQALWLGGASPQEYDAEIARLVEVRKTIKEHTDEYNHLTHIMGKLVEMKKASIEADNEMNREGEGGRFATRAGVALTAEESPYFPDFEAAEAETSMLQREADSQVAIEKNKADQFKAIIADLAADKEQLSDREKEYGNNVLRNFLENERKRVEAAKKSDDMIKASMQVWANIAQQTTTTILTEGVKGHKIEVAKIVEGIGDQMVAQATADTFKALGLLIFSPGQGAALMAVATAEMAAGLAMSAGGHAAASHGGGAGGGGGPANPTRQADQYNSVTSNVEQPPTVIHVHTLTPTVDAGIAIEKARAAAIQRRGPGVGARV